MQLNTTNLQLDKPIFFYEPLYMSLYPFDVMAMRTRTCVRARSEGAAAGQRTYTPAHALRRMAIK